MIPSFFNVEGEDLNFILFQAIPSLVAAFETSMVASISKLLCNFVPV
jgi:hypothetical protein